MVFVKKVEEDLLVNERNDQFAMLKKIFNGTEPNSLFSGVINPVKWQKEIRDEWETR